MASGPNVAANLAEAERLIDMAVAAGAKLVALPEFFAIMGMKETDKVAAAEVEGKGPIQKFLAAQAKKHGIWLVGGSVPMACDNPKKVRNACLVYDDKGKRVARYDKIHLFGLDLGNEHYKEQTTIEAGDRLVVVESPFGRLGLSICYDLRFPELYRAMGDVDIILVPAAFTATTGQGPLRDPDPRSRHREPGLCHRAGAGRLSRLRTRNPWRQHDRRSLGQHPRPPAARFRRGGGRHQPGLPGQPAQEPAGAEAPHPGLFRRHQGRCRGQTAIR
jgi:predicted amidohydrolase